MPPPVIPEKDINTESDSDLHPIGLQGMIKDFNSLTADDTDLNTDTSTYIWTSRSICDLFEVTSDHWVKEYRKKCSRCLNEERSFYELLSNHNVDAAGVEESEFCDYC